MKSEAQKAFDSVLRDLGLVLQPRGFLKSGSTFRQVAGGNSGVINVQRSQSSNADAVKFTLNAGVVCGRLLRDWQPSLKKAGASEAHLRVRPGFFLEGYPDKWWVLEGSEAASQVGAEVCSLTETQIAPFVQDHLSEKALIGLWQSGRSPGLTEKQRVDLLHELTTVSELHDL